MSEVEKRNNRYSRRALLKRMAGMAAFGSGVSLLGFVAQENRAMPRQPGVAGPGAAGQRGAATDTKSTLILLGTQGGPTVNLTRAQTASVVMAGGQPYLFDCGYGTVRGLVEAGIPFNGVRNIFISHLHDDHTADLPALLSLKWTGGNTNPVGAAVHGPFGSKAMVDAAVAFAKANVEIRMVDEGRTIRPETIFSGKDLSAPAVTEVFRDERVTVNAVENTHFPDRAKEKCNTDLWLTDSTCRTDPSSFPETRLIQKVWSNLLVAPMYLFARR